MHPGANNPILGARFLKVLSTSIIILILTSTTAQAWPWSGNPATNQKRAAAQSAFKNLVASCYDLSKYPAIRSIGVARSKERIDAVNQFFGPILTSACLKDKAGTYYQNPYLGLNSNSLNSAPIGSIGNSLFESILYTVDFGFTPFSSAGTICGDGSLSQSVGRGTCSWHGGYARARGSDQLMGPLWEISYPKMNEFSKVADLGVDWVNGGSNRYLTTPVDGITTPKSGYECVKSAGFTTNCFHAPIFSLRFCGSSNTGTFQLQVGYDWVTGWKESGYKSPSDCNGKFPYLYEVNGSSLTTSTFRILLGDGSTIVFNAVLP